MNIKINAVLLLIFSICISGLAQQQVTVEVSPAISKAIKGEKELKREKYFNLAASSSELGKVLTTTQRDYYMTELEMTIGRKLQMVSSSVKWGNNVREDASRPGFADLTYLMNQSNPSDAGLDFYKTALGDPQGLACHEGHDAYPDFMDLFTLPDAKNEKMPGNTDAASELAANLLKYTFTDFQRPSFYEIVNEPHWKFWGDQRFIDLHTKINDEVDAMGLNTKIGGPCYSVSNFYKNEYNNLTQFTNFIDRTNFSLDFYSFHTYDYMKWDDTKKDFVGGVSSGLPLEGVIDAIAAHTFNKFKTEFKYVGSEHGGYISDPANRTFALDWLANEYFPGSGFTFEMEKRSIDNFIMVNSAIANTMTFMNHPHIVEKSVPFILLESSGWDPYYYSSLLVKENFDKNNPVWVESKLIDFQRFFKDVKGRRVHSHCYDNDIQHFAFVDDKTLILLFHNQSDVDGVIDVNIDPMSNTVSNTMVRRLRRKVDFRPEFIEETVSSLDAVNIGPQESIAVFVTYDNTISEEQDWNEEIFYSSAIDQRFTGSKVFRVVLPENREIKNAVLRVGLSRNATSDEVVELSLNGSRVKTSIEDCADRITGDFYATTRIEKLDASKLQESNTIKVTFPDGKSGGVGAVVLRVAYENISSVEEPELDSRNQLLMFPNPAKGAVTISNIEAGNIEMIDLSGKVIKSFQTMTPETQISTEGISNGTYIVRFKGLNKVLTGKLNVTN